MLWLEGTSALVTGGASGLGRAIVRRFIAEGASVTVLDRSPAAKQDLEAEFGESIAVQLGDVRSLADNRAAVALAVERFGKLDSLIANAGIWDYSVALIDLPDDAIDEAFDEIFAINTKGPLLGAKAALPELVRSHGNIVLTLSNAATYADGGGPLYTASKHANVGLVTQLAFELAPYVRVNGIAPGIIPSDLRGIKALGQEASSLKDIPLAEVVPQSLPLAILPTSDDYTGAYVMLASNGNSRMATGAILRTDGGIGIRGLRSIAGGHGLADRFDKNRGLDHE